MKIVIVLFFIVFLINSTAFSFDPVGLKSSSKRIERTINGLKEFISREHDKLDKNIEARISQVITGGETLLEDIDNILEERIAQVDKILDVRIGQFFTSSNDLIDIFFTRLTTFEEKLISDLVCANKTILEDFKKATVGWMIWVENDDWGGRFDKYKENKINELSKVPESRKIRAMIFGYSDLAVNAMAASCLYRSNGGVVGAKLMLDDVKKYNLEASKYYWLMTR